MWSRIITHTIWNAAAHHFSADYGHRTNLPFGTILRQSGVRPGRAQRIPSWPGVVHSIEGRIHLRRPTRHSHFSLATRRRTIHSGMPVIVQESCDEPDNVTQTHL
jgi:hypothetical protein